MKFLQSHLLLSVLSIVGVKVADSLVNYSLVHAMKSLVRKGTISTSLFAEMQILIHGTKNAWTTIRPYDLVLYKLEMKVKGKERGLGVYTPERDILPLCNHEKGSTEFFIDSLQEAYSAETLKSENRLLRIVSADRRGTNCFFVEEYLDSDILIPVRDPRSAQPELAPPVTSPISALSEVAVKKVAVAVENSSAPETDEDLCSMITLAKYDQQIMQLKAQKEIAVLEKRLLDKRKKNANQSAVTHSAELVAVQSALLPKPLGPYSQAVKAGGFVFVSGCIGYDIRTGRLADGGLESEVRQALDNLRNVVEESGGSLSRVCKTTIMMRDLAHFSLVNQIYSEYFNLESGATALPARSTFEVSFLPLGADIEIEAICLI
jgi:2-iminobutanoate/2-iminopropanoate deaminase